MWLAGSTGLEPAASAVTGQRSNQLNYDPKLQVQRSNDARYFFTLSFQLCMFQVQSVGGTGFEPVTAGV